MTGEPRLPFPLESGERVLLCTRPHAIALWPRFVFLLATAALPSGFALGLLARGGAGTQLGHYLLGAIVLWIAFWFLRAVLLRRRFRRTVYVLTSTRVVSVQPRGLFGVDLSSTALDQLGEVRCRVDGLLGALLHFGDVVCLRAERAQPLLLRGIGHPQDVALRLQAAARQARGTHGPAPRRPADGATEHLRRTTTERLQKPR